MGFAINRSLRRESLLMTPTSKVFFRVGRLVKTERRREERPPGGFLFARCKTKRRVPD
jgi:hypothetical protein